MKRLGIFLLLLGLSWSASALDWRFGASATGSLLFNQEWTGTVSGGGIHGLVIGLGDPLVENVRWETGFELGFAGLGAQFLLPVGLSWSTDDKAEWSTEVALHALVGGTFTQPWPSPLVGAEVELRGLWSWTPGVGVGLTAGVRYLQAPIYSDTILPYGVLDVPVWLDLKF